MTEALKWYAMSNCEKDAAVAKHVMGWTRIAPWSEIEDEDGNLVTFEYEGCPPGEHDHDAMTTIPGGACSVVEDFATSGNGMLKVLDHMRNTTKETWGIFVCSTGYQVEFEYEGGRDKPWVVGELSHMGDSLPEAVAIVALRAAGIGVQTEAPQ